MVDIPTWAVASFGALIGVLLSLQVYFFKRMYDAVDSVERNINNTKLYAANTFKKLTDCSIDHTYNRDKIAEIEVKISTQGDRITKIETWQSIIDK